MWLRPVEHHAVLADGQAAHRAHTDSWPCIGTGVVGAEGAEGEEEIRWKGEFEASYGLQTPYRGFQ